MKNFLSKLALMSALAFAFAGPVTANATAIKHSLTYTNVGEDANNYVTPQVGLKTPEMWIGASGSEVKLTADIATLNNLGALSSRIVNATGALAVTQALHDGKTITLNAAAGQAVTLPAATGTGMKLKFYVGTTITSNSTTITTNGTDVYTGEVVLGITAGTGFNAIVATNKIMTLNGTTKGGIVGGIISMQDVGTGVWEIDGFLPASGTLVTPFSG